MSAWWLFSDPQFQLAIWTHILHSSLLGDRSGAYSQPVQDHFREKFGKFFDKHGQAYAISLND